MRHALSILSDTERTRRRAARRQAWQEVWGFLVFAGGVAVLGALLGMLVEW